MSTESDLDLREPTSQPDALTPSAGADVTTDSRNTPASAASRADVDNATLTSEAPAALRTRRIAGRHGRQSAIIGLASRARLAATGFPTPLLDPLFNGLPAMRHTLLNRALDDALRVVGAQLATAAPPSVIQFWIADPGIWGGETDRVGGLELFPTLRARVTVTAGRLENTSGPAYDNGDLDNATTLPPGVTVSHDPVATDPLIEAVASSRHAVILQDADTNPLARAWLTRLSQIAGEMAPGEPLLGSLLALPLRARGQFLGVMALAACSHMAARQVTALQELADLVALAADRDRLLSYSRIQEALAQTVVRNAPVAMALLTGPEHVIALANPAFFAMLGIEQSAMALGLPLASVLPEEAATLTAALRLDIVYRSGQAQALQETPLVGAAGVTHWNVTTSPVNSDGENQVASGVMVAAVDVSHLVAARYRAQESAEEAQERIAQMTALHATSLATASQVGSDPRELLTSILRRSIRLLDARAGVIYARSAKREELEVVISQGLRVDYTGARVKLGQGLAGEVARSGLGRAVADYHADQENADVYNNEEFTTIISVPLAHHNQVIGVLDVLDDAERRAFTDDDRWLLELFAAQAAQAMENARMVVELEVALQKQRDLDRMKDDFIATASHELRTPLTGVTGFLELLLDYPATQADQLMKEFVRQAARSATELEGIAERLLQTSRLDTGRLGLRLEPVALDNVVEESLRAFRALESAQGGARQIEMNIPSGVMVLADKARLKEALDNLISNALKYSSGGSQVRVLWTPAVFEPLDSESDEEGKASESEGEANADQSRRPLILHPLATSDDRISDSVTQDDNDPCAPSQALVEAARGRVYHAALVVDEGIGISEEERSELFGRFARLESARESQIRGAGLGLYICRQTLRAMGGDVWLHASEPGRGTMFALALPDANDADRLNAANSASAQTDVAK
jgi:signal transduction histidine kinase/PAS domain-containing protein